MLSKLPVLRTYAELAAARAEVQRLRDRVAEIPRLTKELERRDRALRGNEGRPLSGKALSRTIKADAGQYRTATPFPHIIIDHFLDEAQARAIAAEFTAMDRTHWHETANPHERKRSSANEAEFGPATREAFHTLNASPFLTFLEELTGIEGLIADPHLRGGGLHEIQRGGLLGVHADFNHYTRLNLWRRLNLLVYLNPEWQDEWGGHLELWDREGKACVVRIAPTFNRAVIFDTSNFSYHGHPHPLNCPEGHSRKSLALYYYTVDYPYADDRTPHSTVFIGGTAE